jgi:hypothetical protein
VAEIGGEGSLLWGGERWMENFRNPKQKRSLGRSRHRQTGNIEIDKK